MVVNSDVLQVGQGREFLTMLEDMVLVYTGPRISSPKTGLTDVNL
jgi:hypothetical protein